MEVKWIKITTNMFDDEKIKLIESMPDKDTILIIWVKLLVQAGKTNASGHLYLSQNIPYTDEMLSTIFNRPLNTVRMALELFKKFGMIDVCNETISISNWDKHQNIEGLEKIREQNRLRKQKQRENQKLLSRDITGHVTNGHATEVDIDLDIDLEKDVVVKEGNATVTLLPLQCNTKNNTTTTAESFYQNNIAPITPFIAQQIEYYIQDGIEESLIINLMQYAVSANKRSWKYIETCLKSCKDKGILTLASYQLAESERSNKKTPQPKVSTFSNKPAANFTQRQYADEDFDVFYQNK